MMKCDKKMEMVYNLSLDVDELCALDDVASVLLRDTTHVEINEFKLQTFKKMMKNVHALRVGDRTE